MKTPRGYKISDGLYVLDPNESKKIKNFFQCYAEHGKLCEALREAELPVGHRHGKMILQNSKYKGNEYLPRLVSDEIYEKVNDKLNNAKRRSKKGRLIDKLEQKIIKTKYVIPKDFKYCKGETIYRLGRAYESIMEV